MTREEAEAAVRARAVESTAEVERLLAEIQATLTKLRETTDVGKDDLLHDLRSMAEDCQDPWDAGLVEAAIREIERLRNVTRAG